MCAAATSGAAPPRRSWQERPRTWPGEVPDGEVDRAARHRVPRELRAALGGRPGAHGVDAGQPLGQRPAHRADDRGLGLAVGVGPRLRLGLADEPGVRVHAHEDVVGAAHPPRREHGQAAVGQRERDRLDRGDPHPGAGAGVREVEALLGDRHAAARYARPMRLATPIGCRLHSLSIWIADGRRHGAEAPALLRRGRRGAPLRARGRAAAHRPAAALATDPPARGGARDAAAVPHDAHRAALARRRGAARAGARDPRRGRRRGGGRAAGGARRVRAAGHRLHRLGDVCAAAGARRGAAGRAARRRARPARRAADARAGRAAARRHARPRPPAPARPRARAARRGAPARAARRGAARRATPWRRRTRSRSRSSGTSRSSPIPPTSAPSCTTPSRMPAPRTASRRGRRTRCPRRRRS